MAFWCVNARADDFLSVLQSVRSRVEKAISDNELVSNFTSRTPDNSSNGLECYPNAPIVCEDPENPAGGCCCKVGETCQTGGGCCDDAFPNKCAKWIGLFDLTNTICCAEGAECCHGKTPKQSTCCDPTISTCDVDFLGKASCNFCAKDGGEMRNVCVDPSHTESALALTSQQAPLETQSKAVGRCIQCCMGRDVGAGRICDTDWTLDGVEAAASGIFINDYSQPGNDPAQRTPVQGICTKKEGVANRWIESGECVFTANGVVIQFRLSVGGCRVWVTGLPLFKNTVQVTADFQLCFDSTSAPEFFPNFVNLRRSA